MTETEKPCFNLWHEAWIGLEGADGGVTRQGIGSALLHAHEYRGLYDASPLVVAGVHRLLTAILQAIFQPQRTADLEGLWRRGHFPAEALEHFAAQYAHRFDLFSETQPFLQTADAPLQPAKGDDAKTIAYLMFDLPSGTAATHYRHGSEDSHYFCPACAASGLVTLPAFATSGGAGIKPSINGVPPIYILPGGKTLFESLVASLLTPGFQPKGRSLTEDRAWWTRQALVKRSQEALEVGYLHSLTFPARRVRLYPNPAAGVCTRCGAAMHWGVGTMLYEMGECRSDKAAFWMDPFAAYREPQKDGDSPTPIRPTEGKATWREFGSLFLNVPAQEGEGKGKNKSRTTLRPAALNQIAALFSDEVEESGRSEWNFRCIGIRTDMKAKFFEWIDVGFEVPTKLLRDQAAAGERVQRALDFAGACAGAISGVFRQCFGGNSKKSEQNKRLRVMLGDRYWSMLAEDFRQFILALDPKQPEVAYERWVGRCLFAGRAALHEVLDLLPDDAADLRKRVEAEVLCNQYLAGLRKKELGHE